MSVCQSILCMFLLNSPKAKTPKQVAMCFPLLQEAPKLELKGCLRYLNTCATSPTYKLYQLIEKNECTIVYHIFFYLKHCQFWKRRLPAIRVLSISHTIFMKFTTGKSRQASFSNSVTCWNAQTNPASTATELLPIISKNQILKANIFCQHKIN